MSETKPACNTDFLGEGAPLLLAKTTACWVMHTGSVPLPLQYHQHKKTVLADGSESVKGCMQTGCMANRASSQQKALAAKDHDQQAKMKADTLYRPSQA